MTKLFVKESTLAKARHMGAEMAKDPVIRPHLDGVLQYQSFNRFRNAHRAYWEQSSRWEKHYQERVFVMADKEASRYKIRDQNSMNTWDVWYNNFEQPIKNAIWETWEKQMNLEARYFNALLNAGKINPNQLLALMGVATPDHEEAQELASMPIRMYAEEKPTVRETFMRFIRLGRRAS